MKRTELHETYPHNNFTSLVGVYDTEDEAWDRAFQMKDEDATRTFRFINVTYVPKENL